jgi:hypothetical protein
MKISFSNDAIAPPMPVSTGIHGPPAPAVWGAAGGSVVSVPGLSSFTGMAAFKGIGRGVCYGKMNRHTQKATVYLRIAIL